MCVSAQFCEDELSLLLRILKSSRDPVIRSNIVIALGDIAVSFGSIIDEVSQLGLLEDARDNAHETFSESRTVTDYMKVYRTKTC
jgi:hypothetical protein